MTKYLITFFFIISTFSYAHSQWARQFSNSPQPRSMDRFQVKDGVIWGCGNKALYVSDDQGISWRDVAPINLLSDARFGNYPPTSPSLWGLTVISGDSAIAICMKDNKGMFVYNLTTDRGKSWKEFFLPDSQGIYRPPNQFFIPSNRFNSILKGARSNALFLQSVDGNGDVIIFRTTDVGKTWTTSSHSITELPYLDSWTISPCGDIFGMKWQFEGSYEAAIFKSSDDGVTWKKQGHTTNGFAAGSWWMSSQLISDGMNLYLHSPNETYPDTALGFGYVSEAKVYSSTDEGVTWSDKLVSTINVNRNLDSISASICSTPHAVYNSSSHGILRSTDRGLSWQNIGGPIVPNYYFDLPSFIAVNDSVLIALDKDNHFWRTTNAGGYPFDPTITGIPNKLFDFDTVTLCDSIVIRSAAIHTQRCPPLHIIYQLIRGKDSTNYSIEDSLPATLLSEDTIRIKFIPRDTGIFLAEYYALLSDGSQVVIPFKGHSNGLPPITAFFDHEKISYSQDTIGGEIAVPILLHRSEDLTSLSMNLGFDTSVLEYMGTASKSGSKIGEVMLPGAGQYKLNFQSTDFTTSDTLGFSVFHVYIGNSGCTNVHFSAINLQSSQPHICSPIVDTGILINICSAASCGRDILSKYMRYRTIPNITITPNPSQGIMSIGSDKNVDASIQIIDALGNIRQEYSGAMLTPKGFVIDIATFPNGTYEAVVKYSSGSTLLRFIILK